MHCSHICATAACRLTLVGTIHSLLLLLLLLLQPTPSNSCLPFISFTGSTSATLSASLSAGTGAFTWTLPATFTSRVQSPAAATATNSSKILFTVPVIPLGTLTPSQYTVNVTGGTSAVTSIPVKVTPPADAPTITALAFRCDKHRLTITAGSNVNNAGLVMKLGPYTDNQGKVCVRPTLECLLARCCNMFVGSACRQYLSHVGSAAENICSLRLVCTADRRPVADHRQHLHIWRRRHLHLHRGADAAAEHKLGGLRRLVRHDQPRRQEHPACPDVRPGQGCGHVHQQHLDCLRQTPGVWRQHGLLPAARCSSGFRVASSQRPLHFGTERLAQLFVHGFSGGLRCIRDCIVRAASSHTRSLYDFDRQN